MQKRVLTLADRSLWRRLLLSFRLAISIGLACLAFSGVSAEPATLTQLRLLNGQFAFLLNGDTNKIYSIERSTDLFNWRSIGLPRHPSAEQILLPATNRIACFRARECQAILTNALVTRGLLDIQGNNLLVDSFDSSDPAYGTDGEYDQLKATARAHLALWVGLTNSVNVGSVEIYGHVATGPQATVNIGPTGSIGDEQWHDPRTPNNVKGVQPGAITDDLTCDFPDALAPTNATSPFPPPDSNGTYMLLTGSYKIENLHLNNTHNLRVNGDVLLYVESDFSLTGTNSIYIPRGSSLKLYVGDDGNIAGNGIINENNASAFVYFGLKGGGASLVIQTYLFVGCVYAPSTDVTFWGSGNSTTDFVGAVVARTATLLSHVSFHYDENLKRLGPLF